MKRRNILIFIVILFCFGGLVGCNADKKENADEYAIWMGTDDYLTEEGYYFTQDAANGNGIMLWYFDIVSGITVPVCDKAECAHQAVGLFSGESPSCNAQIEDYEIVVYKDQVYYLSGEDMKIVLRRRDKDGNNDEKVAAIDAPYMGERIWFYRDHAFIMAATGVSQSFDPETKESDDSVMRLFDADLKSGQTKILAESSLTERTNSAFTVYEMKDGKVSFYDLEKDKWYTYDVENEGLEEQKEIRERAIYGSAGEYWDIWENYGYTFWEDGLGNSSIACIDWKSGEEKTIYAGETGNTLGYYLNRQQNCMYIIESNWETGFQKIYYYDIETGEMKQAAGEFEKDRKNGYPTIGSKEGFIYSYAVNQLEGQAVYAGDFEYRYMSLEDLLNGTDKYQVVYYLDQEE